MLLMKLLVLMKGSKRNWRQMESHHLPRKVMGLLKDAYESGQISSMTTSLFVHFYGEESLKPK